MLKIYHNPSCSKSNCAIDFLNESGKKYDVIDYQNEGLERKELLELLEMLQLQAKDLIRQDDFEKMNLELIQNPTEEYWIKLMLENPKLIQRPIVVYNKRAVIARPLELIETLFEKA